MKDSPARTDPAALEPTAPTARRLVEASVSANTRRAYAGALRRLDAWLDGRELDDATLAAHLAELHDAGRAAASAAMAVAAACFRAKLAGHPAPAGERTARVLAGYRRTAGDRGRGQARRFWVSDLAAVLATCRRPRRRGPWRRVRPDRPRARTGRCGDRRFAVHGRDAAQRGERAALGQCRGLGRGRRHARHRAPQQDEPAGARANDVRFVKDGAARSPDACAPSRVRSRAIASYHCRRR